MTIIMQMTAELVPMLPLSRKNSSTPIAAPAPKHMSCRFEIEHDLRLYGVKVFG